MAESRIALAEGYTISRVLKGGWQLAGGHGAVAVEVAIADMDAFVEAGITTFDCADIYTGVESLIGEYLRRLGRQHGPAAMSRVQVHTKCVPDLDVLASLTKGDVARMIERSLDRLGVERLDLVQLHWWNDRVPRYVEAACWLNDLRREGKIRHVGLTNFSTGQVDEIAAAGVPVVSHQVQYSVLDRRPAGVMAARLAGLGIPLLAYGALAGGFLSEHWVNHPDPESTLDNRSLVKYRLIIDEFGGWDRFQSLLGLLGAIARKHGVTIGTVAIRWVLQQQQVAGVIVGARHARHVAATRAVHDLTLDDDDLAVIQRAHLEAPGPSGDVYGLERVVGGRHAAIMRYDLHRTG